MDTKAFIWTAFCTPAGQVVGKCVICFLFPLAVGKTLFLGSLLAGHALFVSFLFPSRFDGGRQVPCGPLPERKCFFLIMIFGTDGLCGGSLASTHILITMSMPARTINDDNFIQTLFKPESQRNGMFLIC